MKQKNRDREEGLNFLRRGKRVEFPTTPQEPAKVFKEGDRVRYTLCGEVRQVVVKALKGENALVVWDPTLKRTKWIWNSMVQGEW